MDIQKEEVTETLTTKTTEEATATQREETIMAALTEGAVMGILREEAASVAVIHPMDREITLKEEAMDIQKEEATETLTIEAMEEAIVSQEDAHHSETKSIGVASEIQAEEHLMAVMEDHQTKEEILGHQGEELLQGTMTAIASEHVTAEISEEENRQEEERHLAEMDMDLHEETSQQRNRIHINLTRLTSRT